MYGINGKYAIVPLTFPYSHDGAITGDIFSMKNYPFADIWIILGAITKAGLVTLEQGVSVSSAATALAFTEYYRTGHILKYKTPSTDVPAAAGETVTGAGGGISYVAEDFGDRVMCYSFNGTNFVDAETLTFSGGKTAKADGIQINEDIMVHMTLAAAVNQFTVDAVANRMYCIPINSAMLNVAAGMDCVELNIADLDTTLYSCFAVLHGARFIGDHQETAIYD
jgi:hypothetical protein